MDSFMLHYDTKAAGRIGWEEFVDCLNKFAEAAPPEGVSHTVVEYGSGDKYRSALRKHSRLEAGPKQVLQHPLTTTQEVGFLAEECLEMNGGANEKFRRKWTDIAQYGDCVDRNNQGRTIASDMSPSMKKTLHEAQGSTIMIL